MFLPWTPFVLNIILAIFQLLLIGALDAILAIYSRFGSDYANSIRWTRQGGYPEMLSSVYNSWKNLPKATKVAMILTIFVSFTASIADKGAVYFITPSIRLDAAEPFVVKSPQFAPRGLLRTFSGWTSSIRLGTDIVEAMTKTINDTSNIPGAINGRVYTPRTSDYEIICDQFNLHVFNASNLLLPSSGCGVIGYMAPGSYKAEFDKASVINATKGRWSIRVPAISESELPSLVTSLFVYVGRRICALGEFPPRSGVYKPGLVAIPRTTVTKCVLSTGEISILSASMVPFFVPTAINFPNIGAAVFEEYDDLLQAMEVSIYNTTATTNATLFVELANHDSFIELLFCFSYGHPTTSLRCRYHHINMLTIRQQGMDVLIEEARGGKPLPDPPSTSIAMTIDHIPASHNGGFQPISMSALKNATFEAAHYMASLGHNFYADYDEEQKLYVLFDTMDPRQGFSVPDWLLISMTATMVVCLCLWGMTKVLLDARYTSSLYKVVATQLSPQMGMPAPMLVRCKFEPFEFEDIAVVAADGLDEVDTLTTKASSREAAELRGGETAAHEDSGRPDQSDQPLVAQITALERGMDDGQAGLSPTGKTKVVSVMQDQGHSAASYKQM
ncbi:hypothetical protein BGZ72_000696 [Mortierella alpina]|nr:hypothetical protein BGZ72_000696 [Mortierella alpina]